MKNIFFSVGILIFIFGALLVRWLTTIEITPELMLEYKLDGIFLVLIGIYLQHSKLDK